MSSLTVKKITTKVKNALSSSSSKKAKQKQTENSEIEDNLSSTSSTSAPLAGKKSSTKKKPQDTEGGSTKRTEVGNEANRDDTGDKEGEKHAQSRSSQVRYMPYTLCTNRTHVIVQADKAKAKQSASTSGEKTASSSKHASDKRSGPTEKPTTTTTAAPRPTLAQSSAVRI